MCRVLLDTSMVRIILGFVLHYIFSVRIVIMFELHLPFSFLCDETFVVFFIFAEYQFHTV